MGKSPDKKIKDEQNFECDKPFLFGSNRLREQNQLCLPGPYFLGRIASMNVTIGNNGTNDNVQYKICSDVSDFCCEANPKRFFSNDNEANRVDERKSKDFGDCAKHLFKIRNKPIITVTKDGKKSLIVNRLDFGFKKQATNEIKAYRCDGFRFTKQCNPASACTQQLSCR